MNRIETDRERAERFERTLIRIKEVLASRKTRVNMPDGSSIVSFIACELKSVPTYPYIRSDGKVVEISIPTDER